MMNTLFTRLNRMIIRMMAEARHRSLFVGKWTG
jgi:hypothetical protein